MACVIQEVRLEDLIAPSGLLVNESEVWFYIQGDWNGGIFLKYSPVLTLSQSGEKYNQRYKWLLFKIKKKVQAARRIQKN